MPTTDPVIDNLRDAIQRQDWDAARLALHPYLQWTQQNGTVIRGRKNVLAVLTQTRTPPAAPQQTALRDGQIYRWVC
jgi:hypothetical protein